MANVRNAIEEAAFTISSSGVTTTAQREAITLESIMGAMRETMSSMPYLTPTVRQAAMTNLEVVQDPEWRDILNVQINVPLRINNPLSVIQMDGIVI